VSQTVSVGVVDAGRWVGVAAGMVDYLQRWLAAAGQPPQVPKGTFAGAGRFLDQVLEGIALNRHERLRPDIPVMAGLSNWNIAVGVLTQLPERPQQSEELEPIIQDYRKCLTAIQEGQSSNELRTKAESLKAFFGELLQQGTRARQSAFARAESPLPLN
jgi:hypothetical protein